MDISTQYDSNGVAIITVSGEMDLYTAPQLRDAVSSHLDRDRSPLVLDLEQLHYIDSSGIGALLYTFSACKKAGTSVWFAGVQGPVRRVIELTSLLGFFPIAETVEEAIGLLPGSRKGRTGATRPAVAARGPRDMTSRPTTEGRGHR